MGEEREELEKEKKTKDRYIDDFCCQQAVIKLKKFYNFDSICRDRKDYRRRTREL